jgi:hypothetical protein
MVVDVPSRSPWLRQLPPVVSAEVRRRRGQILGRVEGRVLDLDDPDALERAVGPYDTVVCTCRLLGAPDAFGLLGQVVDLLDAEGELQLLEPVGRPGVGALLAASAGTLLPAVAGLHLGRDIPAVVRATGMTITDLDRFMVRTAVWPLRHFVQIRAIKLSDGLTTGSGDDRPQAEEEGS